MQNTWLVVIPPLLVLFLSFTTHRILLSLFLGIICSTMIFHDFALLAALKTAGLHLWKKTEFETLSSWDAFIHGDTIFIYLFLLLLGVIITVIGKTGGSQAYGKFVQKKLHNKRAAETSSLILSLFFFIDDYLNVLMLSSIMPPITDRFKIPRIKLAFFANAFSAALPILVPFSSWGAFIMKGLSSSGVSLNSSDASILASPFECFVTMIPFAFYSFIIIIATFFLVRKKISYGLMKKHEQIAQLTDNLYGDKKQGQTIETATEKNGSIFDFIFPITLLVSTIFFCIFLTPLSTYQSLLAGAITTLTLSIPYFLLKKKLFMQEMPSTIYEGVMLMLPSLSVITLAWTFAEILRYDLQTGQFLATQLIGTININLLPLLLFIFSTIFALGIGSAWGSIAIMLPIAIPLVTKLSHLATPVTISTLPIVIPTISAVLAGAVAGINISPIADIVVMASTSTKSHHMDHVKAQQVYIFPVFIATCIAFLISGIMISSTFYLTAIVSLIAGSTIACGLLMLFNQKGNTSA